MDVQILDLPFDPRGITGFSERLLCSHHQNNYGGAVRRLNAIRRRLQELPVASLPGFELSGLKREELVATNSMLLHELYFECLAPGGEAMTAAMALALQANFGSVERWQEEFIAMAKAQAGGSGWVLLVFQPREGSLVNQWAADHSQTVAGGVPILALDMYEHAYHLDFGADAGAYVDAFMGKLNWDSVYRRYGEAVEAASEALAARTEELSSALIFDVRRAAIFEQAESLIPTAQWRDPAQVSRWSMQLRKDVPVFVYCIYGHEVGRATALRLRAAGLDARFLRGGIEQWKSEGRPLMAKPT